MKNILLVLSACIGIPLIGQVESNFSHFMLKPVSYNIAYAGAYEPIEVGVHYRNQWTGLTGTTLSTGSLDFSMPLPKINSGIGLNMMYDVIGVQKNLYLSAGFAYQLKIKKAKLGMGIAGGIIQSTLYGNLLKAPEGDYNNNFDHRDPIIPLNKASGISPYFSVGLMFTYRKLQIAYSVTNLLEGKTIIANPTNSKNLIFTRNHYASISYKFKLSKSLVLAPNILFKTDFIEHQLDLNLMLAYKAKFDIGLGYRGYNKKSNESVIVLLGMNLWKELKVMYGYDISTGKSFGSQYGSHELSLVYKFNYKAKLISPKIIYNPRFL